MTKSTGIKKIQIIGFVAAIIILLGMFLIQPTEALPMAARNTLGVLFIRKK